MGTALALFPRTVDDKDAICCDDASGVSKGWDALRPCLALAMHELACILHQYHYRHR